MHSFDITVRHLEVQILKLPEASLEENKLYFALRGNLSAWAQCFTKKRENHHHRKTSLQKQFCHIKQSRTTFDNGNLKKKC